MILYNLQVDFICLILNFLSLWIYYLVFPQLKNFYWSTLFMETIKMRTRTRTMTTQMRHSPILNDNLLTRISNQCFCYVLVNPMLVCLCIRGFLIYVFPIQIYKNNYINIKLVSVVSAR